MQSQGLVMLGQGLATTATTTGLTQGEKPGACDCDNETASKTSRNSPAARQQAETTKGEKRCDRYGGLLTRDIPRLSKHPASMAL